MGANNSTLGAPIASKEQAEAARQQRATMPLRTSLRFNPALFNTKSLKYLRRVQSRVKEEANDPLAYRNTKQAIVQGRSEALDGRQIAPEDLLGLLTFAAKHSPSASLRATLEALLQNPLPDEAARRDLLGSVLHEVLRRNTIGTEENEAVLLLLDQGANVNLVRFGDTALSIAVTKPGMEDVISLLLQSGANPNLKIDYKFEVYGQPVKMSAIDIARAAGHSEYLPLLNRAQGGRRRRSSRRSAHRAQQRRRRTQRKTKRSSKKN